MTSFILVLTLRSLGPQVSTPQITEFSSKESCEIALTEAKTEAKKFYQVVNNESKCIDVESEIKRQQLKDNESYLRWLYIEGLKERNGIETIYVPTEAGLPILEAGKRVSKPTK